MKEKLCRKCGEVKPAAKFSSEPRNRDGLMSWCKHCVVIRAKQAYHENRDSPNPKIPHEERRRRNRAYANRPENVARRQAVRKAKMLDPVYREKVREAQKRRAFERNQKRRIGRIRMELSWDEVDLIRACRAADAVANFAAEGADQK